MNRNIFSLCAGFVAIASTIFTAPVKAQSNTNDDPRERMIILWRKALDNVRVKYGASKKEFDVFRKFDLNRIQLLRAQEESKAIKENFDPKLLIGTADEAEKDLSLMYEKFQTIKKQYPSSVEEFERKSTLSTNPCDSSGCTNMDFDQGTLNTWYGYYADDESTATTIDITGATGGVLGAVTEACNDPTTLAYNNTEYALSLTTDYQISLTSGGYDAIVPTIPRVSPWATGGHSVMIGDSGLTGRGTAILSKTFLVSSAIANLTYQYSVFLENPISHIGYEQPFFSVIVLDENGDTIPSCGYYTVVSGLGTTGFDSINSYDGNQAYDGAAKLYYRPWTIVNVPLKNYIGQCVTIEFEVVDCSLGGHFGYAYVDASCSPLAPISSSPNLCGQDSISLTAPPGAATYLWSNNIGDSGILGGDSTTQTIWVDSAGTYKVIITPVTGTACADTLSITVGKAPGPIPKPSFTTNIVCSGTPTLFTNTSTFDSTSSFYWDFYNIGIYNDTNVTNPTWTYASPGVYYVKLFENHNGCGADTVIKVTVDSTVNGGITFSNACVNTLVTFTNASTGGNTYIWNYGDPASAPNDTCTICTNGSHTYTATGTYLVTLIAKNGGPCPDTIRDSIVISNIPKPVIHGQDSICPGHSDTIWVTGGTTYLWSNGETTDTVVRNPSVITTVSVTAYNGGCSHDTSFTIYPVAPGALITASPPDSVCSGAPDTLTGSGGTSFLWSNGQRTSSIVVHPTTVTTYTLYTSIGSCNDSTTITIHLVKQNKDTVGLSQDSICAGTPTTLSVGDTAGVTFTYKWSTGATTTTITVTPDTTTTYYVLAKGACNTDSVAHIVHVIPLPKPVFSGHDTVCNGFTDVLTVSGGTTYSWNNGNTSTTYTTGPITGDSTYTVTAFNGACVGVDSIKLHDKFPPSVTTSTLTTCAGNCVTITAFASGTGPYTYSWVNGPSTASDSVCPTDDSIFYVYVSNGCESPRTPYHVKVYPIKLTACCDTTLNVVNNGITITGDTAILTANQALSYTWSPPYGLNNTTSQTVIATPSATTTYTVTGKDTNGCLDYRVLTVTVDYPCFNFTVPNVFTPNYTGNSLNREFYIDTKNIDAWSIAIYDRWGKEMFQTSNQYQYWQGTNESGSSASDGVYYYIIKGTCQGTNYTKTGYVQLIR